ncbi:hypothetical protein [Candidatus Gillettellia adelgis]
MSSIVNSYTDTDLIRTANVILKEHHLVMLRGRVTLLYFNYLYLIIPAEKILAEIVPLSPVLYDLEKT